MNKHPLPGTRTPRLLLLLLLALALTACSPFGGKDQPTSADSRPTVSIMAPLHFPHAPSTEMMECLQELTGTRLEIGWIPDGIYSDKMTTALTTNSLKKVTFVKHTDYLSMKNSIRYGAFWDIGPYLADYPNLRNLNSDILNQAAVDGKIYGIYTERPSSRQGVILRQDWLDELKLEAPKTIDQLYEVLRLFTYGDPDRNGRDDTVGLTDRNDLVFGAFKTLSSYFGTPNNWGITDGRLIPEFETGPYKATMDFMRKLYEEGLIAPDFAVTSKELQRDSIIRGKAGVYIGSMTDVQRLSVELKAIHPQGRLTLVNRIEGASGNRVWSIPNYNGLYLFSRKAIASEEELRQTLAFFNRTMDKDVANLMRYGLETRHYTVKDGLVRLPEETTQLRVNEVNALHALMIADLSNENLMEVEVKEPMMAWAERLSLDNEQFLVHDPTVGLDSRTYDELGMSLYTIISDATYNYILGHLDADGFSREIAKWRSRGGDQIVKEYQAGYDKGNVRVQ